MSKDILWLQVPAAILQDNLLQSTDLYLSCIKKSSFIVFLSEHNLFPQAISHITTNETIPFPSNDYLSMTKMASQFNEKIEVINLGKNINLSSFSNVKNLIMDSNEQNMSQYTAMSHEQCMRAINVGRQSAQRKKSNNSQLFIGGKIDIRNNISAKAMACALLEITPEELMQDSSIENTRALQQVLNLHKNQPYSPIEILCRLGDLGIAALVGSYISCAHIGLPFLIKDLVSAVAAFTAMQLCKGAEKWFLFSAHSKIPFILFEALHNEDMINNRHSATLFHLQYSERI